MHCASYKFDKELKTRTLNHCSIEVESSKRHWVTTRFMIFHRNSNQIQRRKQHLKIQSWRQTEVRTLLAIAIWRNTWKTCRFARSAGSLPLATNWYFDAVLEHLSFQFDQKGLCLPHSFLIAWCYMSWSFGFRRECQNLAKKQQHDVNTEKT